MTVGNRSATQHVTNTEMVTQTCTGIPFIWPFAMLWRNSAHRNDQYRAIFMFLKEDASFSRRGQFNESNKA